MRSLEGALKPQLSGFAWMAIVGVTVLMVILMLVNPNALWIILSVPFVLFLPGFGMTFILFPGKSLGIPERLLLSVGLSVAFTALSGLILNWTPWGLQTKSLWIFLLLSLAVEIAAIYFFRRPSWKNGITLPADINFNMRQWVLMVLAAVVTIMAIRIARTPAPQQGLEGYTLLSIEAGDAPDTIRVGVESEEFQTTSYQIRYEFNGILRKGSTLQLKPGETWEITLRVPTDELAGTPFTVLLYRLNYPDDVYRRVVWWPGSH